MNPRKRLILRAICTGVLVGIGLIVLSRIFPEAMYSAGLALLRYTLWGAAAVVVLLLLWGAFGS